MKTAIGIAAALVAATLMNAAPAHAIVGGWPAGASDYRSAPRPVTWTVDSWRGRRGYTSNGAMVKIGNGW